MPVSSEAGATSNSAPALRIKGTADQVAERIRAEIESGALPAGAALNQVDLAARFGLSRIPVREALRHLEAEGYVTYLANKGARVVDAAPVAERLEIIEIRECLESHLMDRAVAACTPEVVFEATEALRALNRARTPAQVQGAHERFHNVLFGAAGRPRMAATINAWRFRIDDPTDSGAGKVAFARATRDVHKKLLDALRARDRKAVRRCVVEEYAYIRSIVNELRPL